MNIRLVILKYSSVDLFNFKFHIYWQYMKERFKQEGFTISFENAKYLQDKMSRMPEAINRLCFALLFHDIPKEEITNEDIDSGLSKP